MSARYHQLLKLVVIGDSCVGKSCLLMQFADGAFTTSFMSTIGIDFKIKTITINKEKVKLQVWDTAGQERFRTITTAYYRGAQGIIVVYDVTELNTFRNVRRWMEVIKTHAPDDVKVVLVGNKCDAMQRRMVSFEEGKKLADEYDVLFFETSAQQNHNVSEMFHATAKEILKDQGLSEPSFGMNTEFFSSIDMPTKKRRKCGC
eukprot:TRINITY_DN17444_c0_g1_i1.p1 TRINITY_DN17444_c0_g1~~TRINITY_DN17444_c0_g1_i1.p1  ORF type:complete len:203 (-),score=37.12 TRINITY_DN17444_c0_g1_i1:580-1188(-)